MVSVPLLALLLLRQASPSDTIKQFVAAWNANDHAAMAALILGGKKANLDQMPEALPKMNLDAISEKITGDDATVTVTLASPNPDQKLKSTETEKLKRIQGKWLLLPAQPTDSNAGGLASIAAFAVNPRAVLVRANASAKAVACLSNIKQLGLACLLYMGDHDDKFMPKGKDTHKELLPYHKNPKLWICPSTGKVAYTVNSQLLGRNFMKLAKPAETIMVYEGADGKLAFRHEGRAAVCFANGRAKLVDKAQASKLRFTP